MCKYVFIPLILEFAQTEYCEIKTINSLEEVNLFAQNTIYRSSSHVIKFNCLTL